MLRRLVWGAVLSGAVGAASATAQAGVSAGVAAPEKTLGGAMRSLAARAGVVFVGQVEGIEAQGGVMVVRLAVEQPVLGRVGGTYVVREWSGWWSGGRQRYRVGERAMFFFYAPGAGGLSSPVDGTDGIVPEIPMGADAEPVLDVRWLGARVERRVGDPLVGQGSVALSDAVSVVQGFASSEKEPTLLALPAALGGATGSAAGASGGAGVSGGGEAQLPLQMRPPVASTGIGTGSGGAAEPVSGREPVAEASGAPR